VWHKADVPSRKPTMQFKNELSAAKIWFVCEEDRLEFIGLHWPRQTPYDKVICKAIDIAEVGRSRGVSCRLFVNCVE
jgi:hypothetical protein